MELSNTTEQTKILIVDDNPEIREIVRILLESEGYEIYEAGDGTLALTQLAAFSFDLIILDIMMPHMNGYQTCVEIRKVSNAPILFLTAKTQESDKTLGFSSGGDDYLAKPFSYSELVSRTKALLRRYQVYKGKETPVEEVARPKACAVITLQYLRIDPQKRQVFSNSILCDLTDTEYELLELLVSHRGQIFSAEHLYETVWEEPYYYGASNTIMVHIRNLRRKIEKDSTNPTIIRTVWGKGYCCD